MKKTFIAVAVLFATFAANATSNDCGCTKLPTSYDKTQDVKISSNAAAIKAETDRAWKEEQTQYALIQTKYTEAAGKNLELQVKGLQDTKLDKSVFAVDQARQDKALADSVTKQGTVDAKQTTDLKSYAEQKATSAYTTSVAHTDVKVARADADRKAGDDALSVRIDGNASAQSTRDAGQDTSIQIANEKGDANAVRSDRIEKQAGVLDGRVGKTEVRLDVAEGGLRTTNTQVEDNASYAKSRLDAADANNEANRVAQVNTNKRVAAHTAELANHEQRIGSLEQQTNRSFATMGQRVDRLDQRIGEVEDKANAGTSAALASSSIPQVTEYQSFAVGAGVGGYEGEQALAVGFSSRVSSAVVIKASVTADSQDGFGYNAGLSVGW